MMKSSNLWAISLLVIGIVTIILAGSGLVGVKLPDTATRILGVIDLIAIPVLAFTTVRRIKSRV